VAERMIEANGVGLCTEPFGDPADPPILLVMGVGGSMLWWDEGFCRMLAEGRRFVIRYDHRDTGRSVTYEPGHPDYTGAVRGASRCEPADAQGSRSRGRPRRLGGHRPRDHRAHRPDRAGWRTMTAAAGWPGVDLPHQP
jgi:pimeloyl-ACP methyl ester carboxylesterase